MIKTGYKLLDYRLFILLCLALIASPTLCGINTLSMCLIYSHYLTVYLNNFFLLFLYQFVYRYNQLIYPMIIRTSQKIFYIHTYVWVVGLGFLYNLVIYISYYFFFGPLLSQEIFIVTFFMIINLIFFGLECSIVYLQLGKKKNFLYLALPIFMNFIFHFIWIQYF